ncbi:MAG: VOC family protein [Pseudomonadota bacterium]
MLTAKALILALALGSAVAQPPPNAAVTGLGGFFFRAKDPAALAAWYQEHLGIERTPRSYEESPWQQEAGPTVFAPFPDVPDFLHAGKDGAFVLNFRTRDLDALVAYLIAKDVEIVVDSAVYPNGRFAMLRDPEGNAIQLWEPADPASAGDRE